MPQDLRARALTKRSGWKEGLVEEDSNEEVGSSSPSNLMPYNPGSTD